MFSYTIIATSHLSVWNLALSFALIVFHRSR